MSAPVVSLLKYPLSTFWISIWAKEQSIMGLDQPIGHRVCDPGRDIIAKKYSPD